MQICCIILDQDISYLHLLSPIEIKQEPVQVVIVELKSATVVSKQYMRTFSFFSNTFHIFTCYPNSCTLVVLGSFRFY